MKNKITDSHIDFIYNTFDLLFREGLFKEADELIIQSTNFIEDDLDLVLSILTVTMPARNKLPSRSFFYKKAVKIFGEEILSGLEDGFGVVSKKIA